MKLLKNLPITPKIGIIVGVAAIGLCVAGVFAAMMMKRELYSARMEQTRAIVEMARNMAAGLQKQVDAGQLTKDAAIAEFQRRALSQTYDNGNGYLFAYTMEGITVVAP